MGQVVQITGALLILVAFVAAATGPSRPAGMVVPGAQPAGQRDPHCRRLPWTGVGVLPARGRLGGGLGVWHRPQVAGELPDRAHLGEDEAGTSERRGTERDQLEHPARASLLKRKPANAPSSRPGTRPRSNSNVCRVISPRPMLNGSLSTFTARKNHARVPRKASVVTCIRNRYKVIIGPPALATIVDAPAPTPIRVATGEWGRAAGSSTRAERRRR